MSSVGSFVFLVFKIKFPNELEHCLSKLIVLKVTVFLVHCPTCISFLTFGMSCLVNAGTLGYCLLFSVLLFLSTLEVEESVCERCNFCEHSFALLEIVVDYIQSIGWPHRGKNEDSVSQ